MTPLHPPKDPGGGIVNILQNKPTRQKTAAHTTNQQAGTRAAPPPRLSLTAPVGSSIIVPKKALYAKKVSRQEPALLPRGAWEYLDPPPPCPGNTGNTGHDAAKAQSFALFTSKKPSRQRL